MLHNGKEDNMLTRRNKELKDVLKNATQSAFIQNSLLLNADSLEVLSWFPDNYFDSVVTDPPYGIEFMGKKWDCIGPKTSNQQIKAFYFQKWCYEWAKELNRVLKPGAHLISFCSPRMYHRMVTGIEDAGFEIRDQLQYLYGSGFPKSRNISNDIDDLLGKKGKVIGKKKCSRKGIAVAEERSVRAAGSYGKAKEIDIVEPYSTEAKQWQGWGCGLKPSNEPILLARKPLAETSIARNVLRHGTGGLNIDACQVGDSGGTKAIVKSKANKNRRIHQGNMSNEVDIVSIDKGRFPSNTIIDEEVAELLKDKAKFFYTAKVSNKERNAGCEHLEAKTQNCEGKKRTYNDRCAKCGKKFTGSVESRCQCPPGVKKTDKTVYKNKNNHPTVKPIALMEYLVKLVTPKGGICMDLFMGSGGTGIACALASNNFQFIGIEREPDYFEIAKARIAYWSKQKKVA